MFGARVFLSSDTPNPKNLGSQPIRCLHLTTDITRLCKYQPELEVPRPEIKMLVRWPMSTDLYKKWESSDQAHLITMLYFSGSGNQFIKLHIGQLGYRCSLQMAGIFFVVLNQKWQRQLKRSIKVLYTMKSKEIKYI